MNDYDWFDTNIKQILNNVLTNIVPLQTETEFAYNVCDISNKPTVYVVTKNHKNILVKDFLKKIYEPSKLVLVFKKDNHYQNWIDFLQVNNFWHKFAYVENQIVDEYRFLVFRPPRRFTLPEFKLQDKDVKVLLHDDAGYGDFFYNLRFVKKFPKVKWVVEVRKPLFNLCVKSNLFYDVVLKDIKNDTLNVDYQYGMYNFYSKFGIENTNKSYLNIGENKKLYDISFCFKGNKIKLMHMRRKFNPEILHPISKDYKMINLQFDELPLSWCDNNLSNDWFETAKLISQSRLLISPSTAIYHLGGSLGIPSIAVHDMDVKNYEYMYFDVPNKKSKAYGKNSILASESSVLNLIKKFLNKELNYISDLYKEILLL